MRVDALLRGLAAKRASDSRLVAARLLRLNRGTFHGTERAEDAAVPPIGAKQHTAVRALVMELARVGRHELRSGEAAEWTGQHRNEQGLGSSSCSRCRSAPTAWRRGRSPSTRGGWWRRKSAISAQSAGHWTSSFAHAKAAATGSDVRSSNVFPVICCRNAKHAKPPLAANRRPSQGSSARFTPRSFSVNRTFGRASRRCLRSGRQRRSWTQAPEPSHRAGETATTPWR